MPVEMPRPPPPPFPTPAAGLYPHQERSLVGIVGLWGAGILRVLLVAPTGAGKTVCAAALIRFVLSLGWRCLFLAHRKELIDQASKKLDAVGIDHGVVMADHPRWRPELPVQVASIQTLVRREMLQADVVFIDEAPRSLADSYQEVLRANPYAFVVGLTATPWLGDGKGLRDQFDDLVLVATPAQLIAEGYLVPFDGFSFDAPDLRRVVVRGGDYDEDELERVVNTRRIVGGIVVRWVELARGVRTVVFAVNVRHSRAIVAEFRAAGIPAEHLDGDVPPA